VVPSRPTSLTRLASAEELDEIVAAVAERISADHRAVDHPEGLLLVGVLKGSVCFLADLARRMTVPVSVDFLAVTPYAPGTGRVRLIKDLDQDVAGRAVVIVEDIVDTGLTLNFLRAEIERRRPASIAVVTLVDRPVRRLLPVRVDYVGLEVPDVFVIGYGLDFAGRYRNLHGLWGADGLALAAEPDLHVMELYAPGS
jgi:hypoxanthine phosphoribosyltransferase